MPRTLKANTSAISRTRSHSVQPYQAKKTSFSRLLHWKSKSHNATGKSSDTSASQTGSNRLSSTNQGSRLQQMRDVEAVLFLSREPISVRKLKQLTNLSDLNQTRTLVHLLNQYYDSVGRAFRVESVAAGFLLMTRPELSSWLRRLVPGNQQIRLSSPTMETLVVVAYRQPVLRAEVDSVRGVNCGEILRQLMEIDMVRISGRSEELGRPYLYSTTNRFLKHFGLNNLDELPKTKSMLKMPYDDLPDPESSEDALLVDDLNQENLSDDSSSHQTSLEETPVEEM